MRGGAGSAGGDPRRHPGRVLTGAEGSWVAVGGLGVRRGSGYAEIIGQAGSGAWRASCRAAEGRADGASSVRGWPGAPSVLPERGRRVMRRARAARGPSLGRRVVVLMGSDLHVPSPVPVVDHDHGMRLRYQCFSVVSFTIIVCCRVKNALRRSFLGHDKIDIAGPRPSAPRRHEDITRGYRGPLGVARCRSDLRRRAP